MATNSVSLPAGFELEQNDSPNLPDGFELENAASPSKLQSFGAGAAQGASLGFADEGAGLIAAIPKIAQSFFGGKISPEELLNYYRNSRDSFRQKFGEAKKENPKSYFGGELAGGAATLAVPGAPEASLGNMAAMGGIQGLGNSTADLTQGDVGGAAKDAAIGAGTGAVMSKVAPAIMDGISKIPAAAGWLGKKAITSFLGPSEEAINARLKNPGAITGAKTYSQLAEELPQALTQLQEQIKAWDAHAHDLLNGSPDPAAGAIPKDQILNHLFTLSHDIQIQGGGLVGAADKKAASVLNGVAEDIFNLSGNAETLSESQIKQVIQSADRNINWDDPEASKTNQVLQEFRTGLDGLLKKQNDDYRKAMEPVAEKMRLLSDTKRLFNLRGVAGEGLQPTDTTASNLKWAAGDKKAVSQGVLKNLSHDTDQDFLGDIENSRIAQQFKGGRVNGSKNVNTFAGIGAGAGALVGGSPGAVLGGAAGAATGSYVDKKGGEIAANILDSASTAKTWIADKIPDILKSNPEALGKYAGMFQNAAQGGAQAVSVRHFVLMNQDPQYRQMIHNMEDQGQ